MMGAALLAKPAAGTEPEDAFLRSALATDSPVFPLEAFREWLAGQRMANRMETRRIAFAELDQWHWTDAPRALAHRSGKFFTVQGVRVETDFGPATSWDQPIINQPEIGILGTITRDFGGIRHFLMQAKIEPGNINGIQISPAHQATRSNYTRVHGGKPPLYNEYFTERGHARVLVDRLLGEQGSRFLRKRNRNMIVHAHEDVPLAEGFCWLTLGQIKRLLREDNLVNMTARSVLSCVPFAAAAGTRQPQPEEIEDWGLTGFGRDLALSLYDRKAALHPDNDVLSWLVDLRARYRLSLERRPLDQLENWRMTEDEISHASGRHFSVVAVQVEAQGREVVRWSQPLLRHSGRGLNGFLLQRINGVLHFLVRACLFPGNTELFELNSTVSRANAESHFGKPSAPPFLDFFHNPPAAWVRYSAVHSEEGGRFDRFQSRYMVLEVPPDRTLDLPENYRWMTLGQLNDFVQHGHVTIEGRNLLACLDFSSDSEQDGGPS
ncbi:NDP-hexose 2,3-dehydratase family protein [Azospirillum sp. sgz302134]